MSKAKSEKSVDRRGFLKRIGGGAAGAASIAVGAATPAAAVETAAEKKKPRYRETEHIKKYYATNRY